MSSRERFSMRSRDVVDACCRRLRVDADRRRHRVRVRGRRPISGLRPIFHRFAGVP
jgi:hypothetical protein